MAETTGEDETDELPDEIECGPVRIYDGSGKLTVPNEVREEYDIEGKLADLVIKPRK